MPTSEPTVDGASQIIGLSAGIVPHRQWTLRRWFCATPLWYYHRPAPTPQLNVNAKFYELVDPDLRDLCRLLHDANIHTTPSCQGHFYGRKHFHRVWRQLQRESLVIRETGLPVRDSETQCKYVFHDEAFELPWRDFEDFHEQASSHQGIGHLGLLLSTEHKDLAHRLHDEPYQSPFVSIELDRELSKLLGGYLFNIALRPTNPRERGRQWARVSRYFATVLAVPR